MQSCRALKGRELLLGKNEAVDKQLLVIVESFQEQRKLHFLNLAFKEAAVQGQRRSELVPMVVPVVCAKPAFPSTKCKNEANPCEFHGV